jgi:hypothetical protein
MVTWRGTEDGFVTPSVREIYVRYALGEPGMMVLEATGIRDVASGPLLRLSHDRYVPGLRDLVKDMKAAGNALVVPQIIDFLKIATRKPTRLYLEQAVRRRALPEAVLGLADAEFEAQLDRWLPDARQRRDFLYGSTSCTATGRRSRTCPSRRSARSPGGSRPPRAARSRRASTASSCTSRTRTRCPRSSRF